MKNTVLNDKKKLNEQLENMPGFYREYILSIETSSTVKTLIAKNYDLNNFFKYLENYFKVKEINVDVLGKVSEKNIDEFLHYLSCRTVNGKTITCDNLGKSRYLSSIRSLYTFLFDRGYIKSNPASNVKNPKYRRREKDMLTDDEKFFLLDITKNYVPNKTNAYTQVVNDRNYCMVFVLLTTGLRVSELVNLDIEDYNSSQNTLKIIRKGNKEQIIYLSDDCVEIIDDYIEHSRSVLDKDKNASALFLNKFGKRITARAVEEMIKERASAVTSKRITPHRLRSSYGVELYNSTGDIYLVADALGHENVATTTKHYVKANKDRLERVRNAVNIKTKK